MSPSRTRSKRVTPLRTGPIRNTLALPRGTTNSTPGPVHPTVGSAAGVVGDTIHAAAAVSNNALRGALEYGVQTAYAVIDDYMKRGYEAARSNRDNPNGRGSMGEDKSSYNSWSNPWGPISPLMEQWSVAMRAWTDAWSSMVPGARPGMWPGTASYSGYAGSYAATSTPAITVEVSSQRPVEVTANLKPGAGLTGQLTADSFVPPLHKGVSISHKGGCLKVSVVVAKDQPAGRHNGVIRASDGCVIGDLTVVIAAAGADPA